MSMSTIPTKVTANYNIIYHNTPNYNKQPTANALIDSRVKCIKTKFVKNTFAC